MSEKLNALKEAIEAKMGQKLLSNKDFISLADRIFDEQHVQISPTTLKRIWGYISEDVTPRIYTLDILARFVGAADWNDFIKAHGQHEEPNPSTPNATETVVTTGSSTKKSLIGKTFFTLAALMAVAAFLFLIFRPHLSSEEPSDANPRILKKGQVFATYDDFHPLFGITAKDYRHYQAVPGEDEIFVWAPQYHNPYYHNDGNRDSLMPTITEYWTPAKYDNEDAEEVKAKAVQVQKEAYYRILGKNELRIVFMKDLFDSTYVFLGAYRLSLHLSDTTKVVWIRAVDHCDLDNISSLNNYKNY
ncbi:MAG: hypothetical protein K6D37_07430 [Prevotella sp.]|nr:hypothetical protein [Prevotella sp.]